MNSFFSIQNNFLKIKDISSQLVIGDTKKCLNPVISVIMPVYKKIEYLESALMSVINQNCSFEYEIVVVDNDADSDINENQRLIEKLNSSKIFYYKNVENLGMMNNWNRGIELSRASLITFCHDDDLLYPYTLQILFNLYNKYKFPIMSSYIEIDEVGNQSGIVKMSNSELSRIGLLDLFISNRSNGEGCLFIKDQLLEIGGFDEWYYPVSDYAMFAKLVYYFDMMYLSTPMFMYRISLNESFVAMRDAPKKSQIILEGIASTFLVPSFIRKIIVKVRVTAIRQAAYSIWKCAEYKYVRQSWIDKKLFAILCRVNGIKHYFLDKY